MNKLTTLLLTSVCAGYLLTGCAGKDGDPGPAGPQGPAGPSGQNLTGNMFGFVNTVDETGKSVSKSGITVSLEGVTPAVTATTDANGRFEFTGLRNGTYSLNYTRTDLESYRRVGVGHVGGDQPTFAPTTLLTQPSTTQVGPLFFIPNPANGSVSIQTTLTNTAVPRGSYVKYIVYVGADSTVNSSTGLPYNNTFYGNVMFLGTNTAGVTTTMTRTGLNALGFATGTPVYIIIYGIKNDFLTYPDPDTGRNVYTGLSRTPSTVKEFLVP